MLIIFTCLLLGFMVAVWLSWQRQRFVEVVPTKQEKLGDTVYTDKDFPIQVYYDYDPNRRSNLGNEYRCVQAAINDINSKAKYKFFILMPPGWRPDDITKVLHIRDATGKHECYAKFDGPYGVLAHAFYPPIKKICLDASETWTPTKLGNTLVHEMCHSLGLRHNPQPNSIMNATYSEKNNGLQSGDIEQLCLLYPFIN